MFARRFWKLSRVMSNFTFGCCFVNSAVSSSVTGKPVSSWIRMVTSSVGIAVLTSPAGAEATGALPGAQLARASAEMAAAAVSAAARPALLIVDMR
ncbi:hypothetical protein [Clavibacter michiganensis]|uniref:hypothetical protein n=1 Tax=Clavibacter michiganensis TaxID=28447 RepID=UPI003EB920E1